MCSCKYNFVGSKCSIDLRACSYFPCLNSGHCIQSDNMSNYTCNCTEYYTGKRCDNKIDLCQNEKCSSNGYCKDVSNMPECQCFSLYSGKKCEIESSILTVIKITQTVSIIIVIVSFATITLIILFLDAKLCKKSLQNTDKPKTKKIKASKPFKKNQY